MSIYNEGGWWRKEKNEGTLYGVEENGAGGCGLRKYSRMRQYYPVYMYYYVNCVNLHCVQP